MKTTIPLIIMAFILLISCSCNTKPKTGTLTGKIILLNDTNDSDNDPVNFAGATIALYELADLDTTLVRLNTLHPQIGLSMCQETEFDHRGGNPLKLTTSDADGSFVIEEIDPGEYNLVLFKEDWGVRYLYQIAVEAREDKDMGSISLYPVTKYISSVMEEVVFRTDHTYIIDGMIDFIAQVTFQPKARIYVNPGSGMRFHGTVVTPDSKDIREAWSLMSATALYSPNQVVIGLDDYYSSITFYDDSPEVNNGIIHHVSNAVAFAGSTCQISNVILRYCGSGLNIFQGSAEINNVIVAYGTDDGTNYGISLQSTSGHSIVSNSIFLNMYEAVTISSQGTCSVNNCYFFDNYRGISLRYCSGEIVHNAFDQNFFDIALQYVYTPISIFNNDFFLSKHTSLRPIGRALVNNNNYYVTSNNYINIYSPDLPNNSTVSENLDAKYNYWSISSVDDYLLDATDNPSFPDAPCAYYVLYQPRSSNPVPEAGIQ